MGWADGDRVCGRGKWEAGGEGRVLWEGAGRSCRLKLEAEQDSEAGQSILRSLASEARRAGAREAAPCPLGPQG